MLLAEAGFGMLGLRMFLGVLARFSVRAVEKRPIPKGIQAQRKFPR